MKKFLTLLCFLIAAPSFAGESGARSTCECNYWKQDLCKEMSHHFYQVDYNTADAMGIKSPIQKVKCLEDKLEIHYSNSENPDQNYSELVFTENLGGNLYKGKVEKKENGVKQDLGTFKLIFADNNSIGLGYWEPTDVHQHYYLALKK